MKVLIAALLLAYLPVLGLLIGNTTCAITFGFFGRENRNANSLRLSRELLDSGAGNKVLLFLGAFVPLPVIAVLWQRSLPAPSALPWPFWILPFAALLSGSALLSYYASAVRRGTFPSTAPPFRAGGAGLLAVALASFLLLLLLGASANPEKVPLIRSNPVFLVSWKSVTEFLLFLALSFGLTGGAVLRLCARPAAGTEDPDSDYRAYVRSVGASAALAPALAIPAIVVLNVLGVPETGLSVEVFAAAAGVLLLALAVSLALLLSPEKRLSRRGAHISVLYVLMFVVALAGESAAVGNASFGRPVPPKAVVAKAAEAEVPSTAEPAVEKGRTVFQKRCRACHLIESRLVGPPLKDVLPKYRGSFENLKRYIREPVKVDPGYPQMPQLGLGEEEVDAVARYVMASVGLEKPPERAAAAMSPEEKGKAVFESVCASCHRFDTRLVGPPFKDVIPKYSGKVEWLKRFIREPVKTNAGYPAMPKLGLKEEEIDAVARYLLASVGLAKPPTPTAAAPTEEMGRAVFERVCAVCHRVDTRLVGPPFKDVVPKYKGNVERLKAFIRDPVKVNPVYPAMPKHALKEAEIDAVARYLLASMEKGKLPEKPPEAMPPGERGKAVFETVCSVCHRFDTRLVGPPFKDVVPKYKGNVERLKAFIRDPMKVDPAYPVMPKHALTEEEIDAVARYLLATAGKGG